MSLSLIDGVLPLRRFGNNKPLFLFYILSEDHKVAFVGNPDSYSKYPSPSGYLVRGQVFQRRGQNICCPHDQL